MFWKLCLFRSNEGAVDKLCKPKMGGSRPPPPPYVSHCQHFPNPPLPFISHCQHFLNPPSPICQLSAFAQPPLPFPPQFFLKTYLKPPHPEYPFFWKNVHNLTKFINKS